ncbi:MAG: Eco57I restriction-modification methylase domain-containing protein [Xanthomonadaceae bacterium]|nr:Eco57I restriction-modification methylase domain-containing protein [Xanthomonadaceae bacterium]MDP2186666.1 Eco57I restriction-modification methylase domain-containing protein [Xanthomonadales bacterium]MDZ4114506.1 Eco57I restriction-modification methylase domain-containing protein [Xanthomonadaceae bacterium]MDZ4378980.1 Eco57I restriction-modification methylase domain-containing protein [Xanthomonadaceae bacterium]
MTLLFDSLGPAWRSPAVTAALRQMAGDGSSERGAVFTRPEVVAAMLDLSGYCSDRPLHRMRLLEPSFGDGDFLLPVVERLLTAYRHSVANLRNACDDLRDAVRAVELHPASHAGTLQRLVQQLTRAGLSETDAHTLCDAWLICDDFLLCAFDNEFDIVVGNPPYVRQERIPAPLLSEYRSRFRTLYDRADLYVPFFERALDLLAPSGTLGFICANRWLKNRYGGPLRRKISQGFHLSHFIDMEGVDAFHTDVAAYPAITIVRRPANAEPTTASAYTRVAHPRALRDMPLAAVSKALLAVSPQQEWVSNVSLHDRGDAPWLFDDLPQLDLLRRLESELPTLEQAKCKVGIGVATGCDRVFIAEFDALPVEQSRKLPLVMARDLTRDGVCWQGRGVLNPFEPDGRLANLADYPRFAAYLERHRSAVAARHVAMRSADGWYRTIDRIYPGLVQQHKLLIPDIKGESTVVLDPGQYYPHHNLYYITSDVWDLRALQTVLRSSITVMTVAAYCTRMAGGFLRFQAQYLRRIRLPRWEQVSEQLRVALIAAAGARDQTAVDAPVFTLYGVSPSEAELVRRIADAAQVTTRLNKGRP